MSTQADEDKFVEQPELTSQTISQKMSKNIVFDVIHDKKINFDHAMAHKLIDMPAFVGERPLRDQHVDYLVQCAKNGTFLQNEASVSTCECAWDGIERRLNGHHTSWMRIYMPPDWKCTIQWIRYKAATEDEFRKLYSSIDRGAPRTRSHIISARLVGTPEFTGISTQIIGQLQRAIRLWVYGGLTNDEFTYVTVDKLATLMQNKYLGLCLKVAGLLKLVKVNHSSSMSFIRRAPVIAAMLASCEKHEKQATDFWMGVASGIDLPCATDPRYKLREFLQRFSVGAGRGLATGKSIATAEEMYRCAIQAWNAHRDGAQIQVLRPATTRRPVAK